MFDKILIANRGEIAMRVIRACREMGIASVAVYSEADAGALHVRSADEAVPIGPPAPGESYLRSDKLIAAAKGAGAQAVHPGYGFLAENASFAEAVAAAGLTFIGPPASAIRAMGDKAESKARMQAAGVPTIPGAEGLESFPDFEGAAGAIGYPVLVKASAGGGGKGMRIAWEADSLPEELDAAHREAVHAFGDGRLLLEKYLPKAHHVEFQVFGDGHGGLVHLFERECSVQRRHQKIIEETPSPLLDEGLRAQMGKAAVVAARSVGYANAGTVEFIIDPDTRQFFFLEMNTRLQVEHPITEMVVGLDLVQWQIRVAAGEPFPFRQDELRQRGHAIECRLYAEDPANGFLPGTGTLLRFDMPSGPGVRVDSGFAEGQQVTHFYDPLLAKLVVHAEDREAALRRMQAALGEVAVHGIVTNAGFLQDVLAHPEFRAGSVTTRWVESVFEGWSPPDATPEAMIAAALAELTIGNQQSQIGNRSEPDPHSPWKTASGFRN